MAHFPKIADMAQALRDVQRKVRARTLEPETLQRDKALMQAWLRYCSRQKLTHAQLYRDAGAVTNSYRYAPGSTQWTFKSYREGEKTFVHWNIGRKCGRKCRGGDNGMLRLSAQKGEGETRKWTEFPAFCHGGKAYIFNKNGYIHL